MTYQLIQDEAAQRYFLVDEASGEISVRRDLATDSSQQYTVCHLTLVIIAVMQ